VLPLEPALLALALAALTALPLVPPLGVVDALDPHPDAATATAAKTPPAASPLRMFINSSPRRNAGLARRVFLRVRGRTPDRDRQ